MEPVDHIDAGTPGSRKAEDGFTVTDDLAGLPVTDAELDAVEAFLSVQLRELFAPDSETPQIHVDTGEIRKRRGTNP